ncbi:hypothetical protein, partial [Streptomyces sp. NPDC014793]|uniref:hypothetical protein n=1 Tax=Streptomyces sp. NPDC014793 TaxID=3364914 RepID=UPI0036FDA024
MARSLPTCERTLPPPRRTRLTLWGEAGLHRLPSEGIARAGLDAISVGAILRQSGVMTAALVERMAPEDLWT